MHDDVVEANVALDVERATFSRPSKRARRDAAIAEPVVAHAR
jgi:hypothetical protein